MAAKSRSDKHIYKLADDCISGKIFGTWMGERSGEAFLPLHEEAIELKLKLQEEGVFHVFQYIDLALQVRSMVCRHSILLKPFHNMMLLG